MDPHCLNLPIPTPNSEHRQRWVPHKPGKFGIGLGLPQKTADVSQTWPHGNHLRPDNHDETHMCLGDAQNSGGECTVGGLEKYLLEELQPHSRRSLLASTPHLALQRGEELQWSYGTGYPALHPLLPLDQAAILLFQSGWKCGLC